MPWYAWLRLALQGGHHARRLTSYGPAARRTKLRAASRHIGISIVAWAQDHGRALASCVYGLPAFTGLQEFNAFPVEAFLLRHTAIGIVAFHLKELFHSITVPAHQ